MSWNNADSTEILSLNPEDFYLQAIIDIENKNGF